MRETQWPAPGETAQISSCAGGGTITISEICSRQPDLWLGKYHVCDEYGAVHAVHGRPGSWMVDPDFKATPFITFPKEAWTPDGSDADPAGRYTAVAYINGSPVQFEAFPIKDGTVDSVCGEIQGWFADWRDAIDLAPTARTIIIDGRSCVVFAASLD